MDYNIMFFLLRQHLKRFLHYKLQSQTQAHTQTQMDE